jgi:branched-chain amino acid transport system permease protein
VGAAILVPLEEISNNIFGSGGRGLTFVIYGAIIMLLARFQPGGLLDLLQRRRRPSPPAAGARRAA